MNQATCSGRKSEAAAALVRFVHGSLMVAGVVGVTAIGAGHLQNDPIRYADLGVLGAETAPVVHSVAEPPRPEVLPRHQARPGLRPASVLSAEMLRVRDFVAQRYSLSTRTLEPLLAAAEHSGRKLGVDPLLIVAVMAIESKFNPFAESSMGAQGLMQVIPRFHLDKIGRNADEDALFDPVLNIRVGTQVLVEGLQRFGSLHAALQYYGGALRDPNASYANKVLALQRRLVGAAAGGETGV